MIKWIVVALCVLIGQFFHSVEFEDGAIGGFQKSPDQRESAQEYEERLRDSIIRHPLRLRLHALLGEKVAFLAVAGFLLCALAGYGGFLGFTEHHGKWYRKLLGRGLLFGGGSVGLFLAFLGLS